MSCKLVLGINAKLTGHRWLQSLAGKPWAEPVNMLVVHSEAQHSRPDLHQFQQGKVDEDYTK